MPEASNVGARGVSLPRRGHQSRKDGGVVSIAVYGSDGLHATLSQRLAVDAGSWLSGPTLELVAVIDWGGGELLFIAEDIADIA